MPLMWRVTATWTGGKIGTGFTNFFFNSGVSTEQVAADACRTFLADSYGTAGQALPSGIIISFPAAVDVLEPDNGMLITSTPITKPLDLNGNDTGNYAAPAGVCVSWRTSGVVGGHRVKGRTFLVPMGSVGMQNDGTPSPTKITQVLSAANALISSAAEFVIWARPPSFAAGGGTTHPVLATNVRDTAAVLTSRR